MKTLRRLWPWIEIAVYLAIPVSWIFLFVLACSGGPGPVVETCVLYDSGTGTVQVCVVRHADGTWGLKTTGNLTAEDVQRIKEKLGLK